MKNKYTFEAVNPKSPIPHNRGSLVNRIPIDEVTQRKDGKVDLHMKFQGQPTKVSIDPRLSQKQRNMVLRNQYGIQVPISELTKQAKPQD